MNAAAGAPSAMKTAAVVSLNPAGFAAATFQGDWRAGLRLVADLGFDGAELHVREAARVPVADLAALLAEMGLAVPAIGTGQVYGEDGLSFADPDPAVRNEAVRRVLEHVDLAATLADAGVAALRGARPGPPLVIIGLVRGTVARGVSPAAARRWAVQGIREVAEAAGAAGLRIVVEPINRYETQLGNTVVEVLSLLDEVEMENAGLLADTFHMNLEEADLPAALRQAGDRLWHIHAADSNRWAPGQGHLDFRPVIRQLGQLAYDGYLSCEILPRPSPEEALRLGAVGLRRLLEEV